MGTTASASTIWRCAVGLTLATALAAAPGDGSGSHDPTGVYLGDLISFEGDAPRVLGALEEAIEMWRGCPQFGHGFPRLEIVETTAASQPDYRRRNHWTITVALESRPGLRLRCGVFLGNSITLHWRTIDTWGGSHHCGDLARNLAHEIGHALGVVHAASDVDLSAGESAPVMAPVIAVHRRRASGIMSRECSAADRRWLTSVELAAARSFGVAAPAGESDRPLEEVASEWHRAMHRSGVGYVGDRVMLGDSTRLKSRRGPP